LPLFVDLAIYWLYSNRICVMTNKELAQEILDILTTDSEHPGRMLDLLADDCSWILQPGGTTYNGLPEIKKFIDVAMASRGNKKSGPTKVLVRSSFGDDTQLCIEYAHTFSFGLKIPGVSKKASGSMVEHCNIYQLRDGKISSVHEYTSSPFWWLNLATQLVLKRVWKRTMRQK